MDRHDLRTEDGQCVGCINDDAERGMHVQKVVEGTAWQLFAQQKQWLIEHGDRYDEDSARGLVEWLDRIQDALVEDGFITEQGMFPDQVPEEE